MLHGATSRLEDLRTALTEAMLLADGADALVAMHLTAALAALNQQQLAMEECDLRDAA